MNPAVYPSAIYKALYTNEAGEVVGLDEVQLLDPIPANRIPELLLLLASDDLYQAYQAGLVLAAWGVIAGVDYLRHLVAIRVDKMAELEPHRLSGEDNVYDVIAESLGVAVLSEYDERQVADILQSLLALYGDCYFESKLKRTLLRLNLPELLPAIEQAVTLAVEHGRYYQASQLLPVLAKYDKAYALSQVSLFEGLVAQDERITYNLTEMQEYA